MPTNTSSINPEIEFVYVSEVATETITQQEAYVAPELPSNLVDRKKFIEFVQARFPDLYNPTQAVQLWDVLFGNQPLPEPLEDLTEEQNPLYNPHVRYLTEESCKKILDHLTQFKSGIDFQHLPSGFVLIKNPEGTGSCEVIHFSEHYARFQPEEEDQFLAITLTKAEELQSASQAPHSFTGEQAKWYEWFKAKRIQGSDIYCTEEQLLNAFTRLSNIILEKGCKFEDLAFNKDFSAEHVNPIVLLGRWATVMTNPKLKACDVSAQWKYLPHLRLSTSHEAIRAITDYAGQARSCGFLAPEMNLTLNNFTQTKAILESMVPEKNIVEILKNLSLKNFYGFRPQENFENINGNLYSKFNAYLKGNQNYTNNFLNKILEHSRLYIDLSKEIKKQLKENIALPSSEKKKINPELEDKELSEFTAAHNKHLLSDFWRYLAFEPNRASLHFYQQVLEKIHNIKISSTNYEILLQVLASSTTKKNALKNNEDEEETLLVWDSFIKYLTEYEFITDSKIELIPMASMMKLEYPKIAFLNEMMQKNFTISNVLFHFNHVKKWLIMWCIVMLSLDSAIYKGAKFYILNNRWIKSDIHKYIELQYQFYKLVGGKRDYQQIKVEVTFNEKEDKKEPEKQRKKTDEKEPEIFEFKLLGAHLSTFHLDNIELIKSVLNHIPKNLNPEIKERLKFCFALFEEAENNQALNPALLIQLIQDIINFKPVANQDWRLGLVNYLKSKVESSFPVHFFEKQEKLIADSIEGLNAQQIANIQSAFPEESWFPLSEFQALLVRKKLPNVDTLLNQLNTQLLNLKYIIPAEDFLLFAEQLRDMGSSIAEHYEDLSPLLNHILKIRNTESFNQIFIRNEIEQATDNIPKKFLTYIAYIKELSQLKDLKLNPLVLQEALSTLILNSSVTSLEPLDLLHLSLKELIEQLNQAASVHPHIAPYLLDCFNHLPNKNTEDYLPQAFCLGQDLKELSELLKGGEGAQFKEPMIIIYSLLAQYHEKPTELSQLMNKVRVLPVEQRTQVLKFVSRLLDNKQSIVGLETLVEFLALEKNQNLFAALCASPPYPDIVTLNNWLKTGTFDAHYATFNLLPLGPRRADFAFNLKQYHKQQKAFVGLTELFTDELGKKLEATLSLNRQKSVQQLLAEYHEVRKQAPLDNENKLKLLCLCVEILARTASQTDPDTKNKISQELNTTQIMALYAKLVNPSNRLLSQIDTGEGKSRVMMTLAACQAAQGKTVDFLTSDLQLAERDYLSYRQFFTTLNIPSSLITLNTPALLYQEGGINITDNSQLLLLRNKSDIEGQPFAYKDKNPKNHCLLIDEVDKFIHDKSKDSFNYAARSKHLADFVWVYPNLMHFIEGLNLKPGQPFDASKQVDAFLGHVKTRVLNKMHKASLLQLAEENPSQINTWLKSAHKAWFMEADKHYMKTEASNDKLYLIRDHEGRARYSRKIYVLDNGRPVEGSTFSDGVHQCICAKENISLQKQNKNKKTPFLILPENEILRPSFPVTFMADYDQGSIYGVSGTTRSEAPLSNFEEINYEKYAYLIIPREKSLKREEKNIWLAKDEQQQIEFIKRDIIKQMKEKGAVLLICKDDQQSLTLQKALDQDAKFKAQIEGLKIQRIEAKTSKKEEVNAIDEAGKSHILTIGTAGMLGRGVDIDSDKLMVLCAYVPTKDDEIQIKGRAARMGKLGKYRMLINKNDPDYPINGATYNVYNEVQLSQSKRQKTAAFLEEASKLFAFFREDLVKVFLEHNARASNEERLELFKKWKLFLGNLHRSWESCRSDLLKAADANQKDQFFKLFNAFTEEWISKAPVQFTPLDKAEQNNKLNTIYTSMMAQQRFFLPKRQRIKTQLEYDPADDGQARIYSSLFAQTRATLKGERRLFADFHAWREGRGQLFPDFMAILKGERMPFANLYATICRWIEEWSKWIKEQRAAKKQKTVEPVENPVEGDPRIAIKIS